LGAEKCNADEQWFTARFKKKMTVSVMKTAIPMVFITFN